MASWLTTRVVVRQLGFAALPLALALIGLAASPAVAAPTTPVRAAFYQPWSDGGWPQSLPDEPLLGRYDSGEMATVAQQVRWMSYARVDAGIASWDGQASTTDSAFPGILQATGSSPVKWSLFYQPEATGDPSATAIAADLAYIASRYASQSQYLRIGGRPVLFVRAGAGDGCDTAQRWQDANTLGFYLVLEAVNGYATCAAQPDAWHEYSPGALEAHVPGSSFAISPGSGSTRSAIDWDKAIEDMLASGEPLQLINSWNQWDQGSAVEPSTSWVHSSCLSPVRPCTGVYLNRLHRLIPESIVSAAGDIACDPFDSSWNNGDGVLDPVNGACRQKYTADLLAGSDAVLTLGDEQYEEASTGNFAASYDPTWGRFRSITHPTPGDHEYQDPNASGYYQYFGAAAGDPAKGYYSFDQGSWHIVSLNSNCNVVSCAAGSAQEQWLRGDLYRHRGNRCTLAIWHFPHFTDGPHVADEEGSTGPLWQALYDGGAELVLSGNDHNYQRFAPRTADGTSDTAKGIRQFIVGTGGKSLTTPAGTSAEVRHTGTFGVLRLTLYAERYEWQFVKETADPTTFTDSGSESCH
jgi:acid phosphatase type 7